MIKTAPMLKKTSNRIMFLRELLNFYDGNRLFGDKVKNTKVIKINEQNIFIFQWKKHT